MLTELCATLPMPSIVEPTPLMLLGSNRHSGILNRSEPKSCRRVTSGDVRGHITVTLGGLVSVSTDRQATRPRPTPQSADFHWGFGEGRNMFKL